ncbi:MAG: 4-hydroxythreonine-4-phosphate dehydrogenase PdxA [Brevinematia bacterium]
MNKKIGITVGNPNGIGPEIVYRSLKKISKELLPSFKVFLNKEIYNIFFKELLEPEFEFVEISNIHYKYEPGVKSEVSGLLSYLFLKKAADSIKSGEISGLVTAPLSKELIVKAGIKFIDHTTFLAEYFKYPTYMLFYAEKFKVILATIHIPLKDVSRKLTPSLLEDTIRVGLDFCTKVMKKNVRVGVCGINPHAGEGGILGKEEKRFYPVIKKFVDSGYSVEGPLPADTIFYRAYRGDFDLIVASYHDQGLAPFKMLYFDEGVNVTLGLPFIRTSPDHGCAFDIAGKNIASEKSMDEAIELSLKFMI